MRKQRFWRIHELCSWIYDVLGIRIRSFLKTGDRYKGIHAGQTGLNLCEVAAISGLAFLKFDGPQ